MAYFEPFIDAEGVHIPTYYDIQDYLTEQYKAIFGDDVYLGEETPDYQMISLIAKCLSDFSALAVQSYNDRNPMYASGDALDVLVQLSGITRRLPTYSTATLTVTGVEGTVIPLESQAVDDNGILWNLDAEVTIPEGGTTTVTATCDDEGAVIALAGMIGSIYTPVPGWQSVTNATDATAGRNMETDAELRVRFAAAHAMTASGITSSFITGLLGVDGVTFATIAQNDTGSINSDGLPGHTFCAIVDGGDDTEVAEKILSLKSPGVGTYGNVNSGSGITVQDEYGNNNVIKFSRPVSTTVSVTVSIVTLDGYDADRVDSIIKGALISDITSLGIGKPWTVSMGYKDIYSQFDSSDLPFSITSITATGATNGIYPCSYDHILTTDEDHITISTGGG